MKIANCKLQIDDAGTKSHGAHVSGRRILTAGALLAAWLLCTVDRSSVFGEPPEQAGAAENKTVDNLSNTRLPGPVLAAISRLGDPRFEIREQATTALEQAGIVAIAPLRDAAAGDNLEITCRAIKSLSTILDTNDDAAFDTAEAALEQLESSANPSASRRAALALDSQPARRWKRAVARLNLLGGGVKGMERTDAALPEANLELGVGFIPTHVILHDRWSGGSAGLLNIKRMNYALKVLALSGQVQTVSWPLPVYVIDGAVVPPQALEELQQSLPGLDIQARGPARLGVKCDRTIGPCFISEIERNSGAEKAGLRRGDFVVRYDGETVSNFEQLTQITRRHKAADRVKLGVERDGQMVELEVELSGWDDFKPKPKEK